VVAIEPVARDGVREWWYLVGKLADRIEPRLDFGRSAWRVRLRAANVLGEDLLNVRFNADPASLRSGRDFIRDFDRDFHAQT
jgi:hypothetical protein